MELLEPKDGYRLERNEVVERLERFELTTGVVKSRSTLVRPALPQASRNPTLISSGLFFPDK